MEGFAHTLETISTQLYYPGRFRRSIFWSALVKVTTCSSPEGIQLYCAWNNLSSAKRQRPCNFRLFVAESVVHWIAFSQLWFAYCWRFQSAKHQASSEQFWSQTDCYFPHARLTSTPSNVLPMVYQITCPERYSQGIDPSFPTRGGKKLRSWAACHQPLGTRTS